MSGRDLLQRALECLSSCPMFSVSAPSEEFEEFLTMILRLASNKVAKVFSTAMH